ncbi:hypothetical protein [Phytoactinopolyspora limicola]|uniref:hypothetical protein n=1 Tax=Phytoactinopolyspora limicola TaxID=2715536 RepID=UPI0014077707|nr:hypothetical protein [Phytoactinopolyspora limicola]
MTLDAHHSAIKINRPMSTTSRRLGYLALALIPAAVVACTGTDDDAAPGEDAGAVTVQGEHAAETNIPTASGEDAAQGEYLALDTTDDLPAGGWFATYDVEVPADGLYRLDAVVTPPAMDGGTPFGGSYVNLSVNGDQFTQVAKSEPYWSSPLYTPAAWGSLAHVHVGDVELDAGANTVTFMVDELRVNASPQQDDPPGDPSPPRYRFFLDEFTLTPTDVALAAVHLGAPDTTIGVYRGVDADPLNLRLNGRATTDVRVEYSITDFFDAQVDTGAVTVPTGEDTASVDVPELPPGSYRVVAHLADSPDDVVVGHFARLPDQEPVGADGKFAVTTNTPWLVPSSKLDIFAEALRDAGVGYTREEISWPLTEPERGEYDTRYLDRVAATFREHGLRTLGALWYMGGNAESPSWAMTSDSYPLPADLRDAYRLGNYLAGQTDGIGGDALELWNEPDVDVLQATFSRTTGDQHAAYLKAAALGAADVDDPPLVSLTGIAFPGVFQDVMLQNGVVRYADIWAYHGYADHGWDHVAGPSESPLPTEPWVNQDLRRLYGAETEMWMTEAGAFMMVEPSDVPQPEELTPAQQRDQARMLVRSTVDSLAAGTDKHFWFSGAPYCAGDYACFGLVSRDFQPWPAYSAHAAMASLLGEARYVHAVNGLPEGVTGHVFTTAGQQVTVLWAESETEADVPVAGDAVDIYTIMGEHTDTVAVDDGSVTVTATPDVRYVVSDADASVAEPGETGEDAGREPLSAADRIVLNQRFADAAPEPPPFGYRLADETTEMTLDVYNFDDADHEVTVAAQAFAGWTVDGGVQSVTVPAHGHVELPFTVTAGPDVTPGVDYPLVFDAAIGDDQPTTPSVSRIQLAADQPGEPIPLAPLIDDLTATTSDGEVTVEATLADDVSGIDPARITVEVGDQRIDHNYDPDTGRLTATGRVDPGEHTVWVRAYNYAHAPAHDSTQTTVGESY